MEFKHFLSEEWGIQEENVLIEARTEEFQHDQIEPFNKNVHVWTPLSSIEYQGKDHAVYKKIGGTDEKGNRQVVYGINHEKNFVPIRTSTEHHKTATHWDLGHSSNEEAVTRLLDVYNTLLNNPHMGKNEEEHAKIVKKQLGKILTSRSGISDELRKQVTDALSVHPKWEFGKPSTDDPRITIKYKKQGWEQKASKTGRTIAKTGSKLGSEIKVDTTRSSYQDFYQPDFVDWNGKEDVNFLEGQGGFSTGYRGSEEILNNIFSQKKDSSPEETEKINKIKELVNTLDHDGLIGIKPEYYFNDPDEYKKRMLKLISHAIVKSGWKTLKKNANVITTQEIVSINNIVKDLNKKIDSGTVTKSDLGQAYKNMSQQIKNPNVDLAGKLRGGFVKNMSRLFVASSKILDGDYLVFAKGDRSQLGGVLDLFKRDSSGETTSENPLVTIGSGAHRVSAKSTKGMVGDYMSMTGILKTFGYKDVEKTKKGKEVKTGMKPDQSIAAVESIKPLLYAIDLPEDERPYSVDSVIIKVMGSPISENLKSLLIGDDQRLKNISSKVGRTSSESSFDDATEKEYFVNKIQENIKKNELKIKRQILLNAGVHRRPFMNEMNLVSRFLSDDKKMNKFLYNVIKTKDPEVEESLKRVLVAIRQQSTKGANIDKLAELQPEDLQFLSFFSMLVNKKNENMTFHHVDVSGDSWTDQENYGLRDAEKGYFRPLDSSFILGFLSHFNIKSKKNDFTSFFQIGKHTVSTYKKNRDAFLRLRSEYKKKQKNVSSDVLGKKQPSVATSSPVGSVTPEKPTAKLSTTPEDDVTFDPSEVEDTEG